MQYRCELVKPWPAKRGYVSWKDWGLFSDGFPDAPPLMDTGALYNDFSYEIKEG